MNRNQYIAAIDIDGPIYELVPVLRDRIHRTTGRPLDTLPEPHVYDLKAAWGVSGLEVRDHLIAGVREGDIFWRGEAHLPGLEGLKALKEAGFWVKLVTARDLPGVEDLCREATEHWLASVGAVYDELILTSDKTGVAYDFLYDDWEVNVRAAHAVGREALLQNRHWNLGVDLPQADWSEIPALVAQSHAARTAA